MMYLLIAHISGEGHIRALADKAIKTIPSSIITRIHNSRELTGEVLTELYLAMTDLSGYLPTNTLTGDYLSDVEIPSILAAKSAASWGEWVSILVLTRLCSPSERIYKNGVCLWRVLVRENSPMCVEKETIITIIRRNQVLPMDDDDDDDGNEENNGKEEEMQGWKEVKALMESTSEEEGVQKAFDLIEVIWNEDEPCIPLSSLLFLIK